MSDLISRMSLKQSIVISMILADQKTLEQIIDEEPSIDAVPVIRCKDCRWGREVCGNIECFVDSNIPPEYHGYDWFCPNGERRTDG